MPECSGLQIEVAQRSSLRISDATCCKLLCKRGSPRDLFAIRYRKRRFIYEKHVAQGLFSRTLELLPSAIREWCIRGDSCIFILGSLRIKSQPRFVVRQRD